MGSLEKEFGNVSKLLAKSAPDRSLENRMMGPLIRESLKKTDVVYFGEFHDDVNLKFLADNPGIFRESRAAGARYMFSETPVTLAPLINSYYNGKINDRDLRNEIERTYSQMALTSGDTPADMAKGMSAMLKTAKANGVRVLPSDFRVLHNLLQDVPLTSDVFGIPDIQGEDDAVRHKTLESLDAYRKLYPTRSAYPQTDAQQHEFFNLHLRRLSELDETSLSQLERDMSKRLGAWEADKSVGHLNLQNSLQADYYSRMVEPGQKALFFGGRDHIIGEGNTGEILKDRGYGNTTSIELMSSGGSAALESASHGGNKLFDYTVMTETGLILGSDRKPIKVDAPRPIISNPVVALPESVSFK